MICDNFCSLRKEVVETGEGIWFAMTLDTGEEQVVRLHRVNVVAGEGGPAIEVVRRERPGEVQTIALARIRGMRPMHFEQGA